ncbi:MAG: VCBS repeat-containing protein, partial [Bacteroidota bacterium]
FTDTDGKWTESMRGWWNSISGADLNGDGHTDYILGNYGLNNKFKHGLSVHYGDLDGNGKSDIVLAHNEDEGYFPIRGRECSSEQMPDLQAKFPDYESFARAQLVDIYPNATGDTPKLEAWEFGSVGLWNDGEGGLKRFELPDAAQVSPVFGTVVRDFDMDAKPDVLLTGNFYAPEVETGRQDAGTGLMLAGKFEGDTDFTPRDAYSTGFLTPDDVRAMALTYDGIYPVLLVTNNDGDLQSFVYRQATGKGSHFEADEAYAIMEFKDGKRMKIERYWGSGYLSQSSQFVQITQKTAKLTFYKLSGEAREIEM